MIDTKIQWADSSINLEMGCTGCELWNRKTGVRRCYAGVQTDMRKGMKGWPEDFELPRIFPERVDKVIAWSDLTGRDRPDKPWLNGLPRVVFLNDMGDTFTEGLDLMWMSPYVPKLAASPHIYIVLTKRPARMAQFWKNYGPVPENFWLCTTLTNRQSLPRIRELLRIEAQVLGLSIEPLWEDLRLDEVPEMERIDWVKVGGESGAQAKPCDLDWIRRVNDACRNANPEMAVFVKQLGARPVENGVRLKLADGHGGDWDEWAEDLKVREMPGIAVVA